MSGPAKVSSIDALEAFRASLIRYIEKARAALDEAESEVRRTRTWLETDRARYWEFETKKCRKRLEAAEADFYNARITRPDESHVAHKMMVARARRALEEAEQKALVVKKWSERYDNVVMPIVRQLSPCMDVINRRLPQGVHQLGEAIKLLQDYTGRVASAPMAPPVGEKPGEGGGP